MDDSFAARVQKAFGALAPSASRSSSSPWTLTDDKVERRRWKLDQKDTSARDETPSSSSFDDFLRKDRRQRSFRDDDIDGDDRDRDEWEIRSSIGLDNTLDNEEEEDEFDKVAAGREKPSERLYMSEVTDQGPYLNVHNVLPNSLYGAAKDPRANLHAARIRLKEDEAEAQKLNFPHPDCDTEIKESHGRASENSSQLKSILKRKGNSTDFKEQKRVRFDPDFKIDTNEASEKSEYSSLAGPSMVSTDSDDGSQHAQNASRVPDYLLNPSKYTRYSFDSSTEYDEESNLKDSKDLQKVVQNSNAKEPRPELENVSDNHPKPLIFIPKKKACDVKAVNISGEIKENTVDAGRQLLSRPGFPVGIASVESQDCEVITFDEIDLETNGTDYSAPVKKPGRNYRMQSKLDDSDS